jgi:RHS repeat-associated protein
VRYTYDVRADVHTASDTEQLTPVPAGSDLVLEPAGRLYTFTYDGLGREREAITHFVPAGAPGEGRTLTSSYDLFENRTGLELAGPAELLTHTWTFDALDRPFEGCFPQDQPCAPGAGTIQIAYRPNDDLDLWTHGNGTTSQYTYEPQGRIDAITVTDPAEGIPLELVHDYDATLNVTSIRELQNGQELTGPSGATPARVFGYDGIDRLTSATFPTGIGLPERDDYNYDPAGNRDEATLQGTPLGTSTYDANNRIQTAASARTYVFDSDGNQTQIMDAGSPSARLSFDFTNRLRRYEDLETSSTMQYFYDPFGRRIRKVASGVTTWYVWDGDRLIAEYDGSGARAVRYAYAGGFAPAEVAFAAPAGGESIHSVHSDHLDTPRLLTDNTATESWRASYRAYGAAIVDADPDGDGQVLPDFNVRLPGQYFDAETGLHYNYHRTYDPQLGRYLSADPIGQDGRLTEQRLPRSPRNSRHRRVVELLRMSTAGAIGVDVGSRGQRGVAASGIFYNSDLLDVLYDETVSSGGDSLDKGTAANHLYTYAAGQPLTAIDPLGLCPAVGNPEALRKCLKACKGGTDSMLKYCRAIRDLRVKALCYGAAYGSLPLCNGYCYARFVD